MKKESKERTSRIESKLLQQRLCDELIKMNPEVAKFLVDSLSDDAVDFKQACLNALETIRDKLQKISEKNIVLDRNLVVQLYSMAQIFYQDLLADEDLGRLNNHVLMFKPKGESK